jgi:SET domain-containing protein
VSGVCSNWPYREARNSSNHKTTDGDIKSPATTQAVILGLGSLFNYSTLHQNVGWTRDLPNLLITYTTLRDIRQGEELCISYGDRLTFVDIDARESRKSIDGDEDLLAMIQID